MSSKRRIRKSQCGQKKKYRDQTEAYAALSSLYRREGYVGQVYRCRWCGSYHLGRKASS